MMFLKKIKLQKNNLRLNVSAVKIIFAAAVLLCTAVSCRSGRLETKMLTVKRSDGSFVTVHAEMAVTPEQREHGFMERKNIPDGTGMLFVFEKDQILSFWMKNTPSPLSIAYITSDGRIRDIFDMTPFSLSSIESTGYVRYALEVPQGWFREENIQPGDTLIIDF